MQHVRVVDQKQNAINNKTVCEMGTQFVGAGAALSHDDAKQKASPRREVRHVVLGHGGSAERKCLEPLLD